MALMTCTNTSYKHNAGISAAASKPFSKADRVLIGSMNKMNTVRPKAREKGLPSFTVANFESRCYAMALKCTKILKTSKRNALTNFHSP